MVTVNSQNYADNVHAWELRGLTSDTKPTEVNGKEVPNGSVYYCIDTGDLYMYSKSNQTWYIQ